jgi:ribosome biogenesis GTPase
VTTHRAGGIDLDTLGWDADWQGALAERGADLLPGRVSRVDRGGCGALTATGVTRASYGGNVLAAAAENADRWPCAGDWVGLRHWPDDRVTAEVVLPRRTALRRATAAKSSLNQLLAANVDRVLVAVPLAGEINVTRIERFLALAADSDVPAVIVLTKADLASDQRWIRQDVAAAAPGTPVVVVSTRGEPGIDELAPYLPAGETAALVGVSGAGKSTLVNALVGATVMTTRTVRTDDKGRHTTTHRELVMLPGGGVLIDTPGVRGVGLGSGTAQDSVDEVFPEIEELAERCRFANCTHVAEPDCAVLAAVADGELPARRLESFQKLRHEAERGAARRAARQRADEHRAARKLRAVRGSHG